MCNFMSRILYILCICNLALGPISSAVAGLSDPTRPADYSEPAIMELYELPKELIEWKVTVIRISANERSAVINGKLVRIGDEIGPARIIEINPGNVILDYEDKQVVVRLFSDFVHKKMSKE